MIYKIWVVVLLMLSSSWGGYFLDETSRAVEPVRELPEWIYGGALDVAFYLNSLDVGGELSMEYRLHKNHSLALTAGMLVGGELYQLGLDWRLFFNGKLMQDGSEDFFRIGFSGLYFEKFDDGYFPPVLTFGYGRNFLPLKKANFLCRLEVRLSYVLGESVPEKDSSVIVSTETNLLTHLDIGFFWF